MKTKEVLSMLDLKWIRKNVSDLRKALDSRKSAFPLDVFLEVDKKNRKLLTDIENLKHRKNFLSDEVASKKKKGTAFTDCLKELKELSQEIKQRDTLLKELKKKHELLFLSVPNCPHDSVPLGKSPSDNKEVCVVDCERSKNFPIQSYWDLLKTSECFDFSRATKLSGSGFALYRGFAARLERSLINFMLDFHGREYGYEEISPPILVNRSAMRGTGQWPNLVEDSYCLHSEELYLIPTAEVPLTNIHADEILNEKDLPRCFMAYTPCFRREAGSYGKDVKGLMRLHQFDKVELVRIVHPQNSYEDLELLRSHAESILKKLELPYRVLELCTSDIGFSATKCYDIEVWAPGQKKYLEVSSCSHFSDFQSRRMGLKYRSLSGEKHFVHTLNASGLALPRTIIAILEHYQNEDGSIAVPRVLQPYLGTKRIDFGDKTS